MRRNALIVGALSFVFAASVAQAQAPNFSGSWTRVADPNAAPTGGRGGGGGLGEAATLTQDAKTLTITRTTQNGEVKIVYNLDGSDSKNMVMGRGGQQEQISKAKWDGANLVVTRTQQMGENSVEIKQTFSVGADGVLTIETTRPGQDGNPMSTKVQYKKG